MNSSHRPRLSIVFLNYNRLADTRRTVMHLRTLLAARDDIEVIAVDNASSDGTRAYLRSQAHWLNLVEAESNLGIAALNEGFKQAKGDYIFVHDDDSYPCDEATLDFIIGCLDTRSEVGVVACRIESSTGQVVRTWHLPQTDSPGPSMAFVGCGFAIRRSLFEKVGWYPGWFFLYQNEMEVAIRVMKQGYGIHYDPCCRVVHRESTTGRSSWRRVYFPTRNTIWIIRRYFPFPGAAYLIASRLCMGFIRAAQSMEFGWYLRAVRDAFSEPVGRDILPPALRKRLTEFREQNSLCHQLTRLLS
ncbi:MAG: glycosyltransferase family 2 protein [Thermodesulfobacteriota bacterium]|nr:glycosyltransferase family 2 protein [Thermodesulfobacteriota bacterium]